MRILVFMEVRDKGIKKSSLEALRAASGFGGDAVAVVLGEATGVDQLGGYGASKVLHAADARLNAYSTTAYAKALFQAVEQTQADVVFLSATSMGKDLGPRLAVKIEAGLAADVTVLREEAGQLTAVRPVYAGKALEAVRITTPKQIFTLRPNVFSAGTPNGDSCPVEDLPVTLEDKDFAVKATGTSIATGKLDVSEASIIVSGGRGMQGPEHWGLIEDLAAVLGAATGASRAVVDAGWRPHGEQVGQTGKTVSPTLYVACGISGAIQHLAGMSSSKVIVAVNKDKDAPIFQVADYGIVGDVFEVLPVLTEELKGHFAR